MRCTYLLALALLGGCAGGPQDTTLDIVSDVCEPTAVIAPADASAAQLASIDAALAMWADLGFDRAARVEAGAEVGAEQHVSVVFEEAAEMFHGLYDDENGIVYINSLIDDDHARAVTVAHELGHSFGLWHVDAGVRVSVMNPANMVVEPNESDAGELVALWGACRD